MKKSRAKRQHDKFAEYNRETIELKRLLRETTTEKFELLKQVKDLKEQVYNLSFMGEIKNL